MAAFYFQLSAFLLRRNFDAGVSEKAKLRIRKSGSLSEYLSILSFSFKSCLFTALIYPGLEINSGLSGRAAIQSLPKYMTSSIGIAAKDRKKAECPF